MMLGQYLAPMLAFQLATLVAIAWPRLGAGVFVLGAAAAWRHFNGASPVVLWVSIVVPLVLLSSLFLYGRARPKRLALALAALTPIGVAIGFGAGPAWRVAHRLDDGIRGARTLVAEADTLTWAPAGPGWPGDGVSWHEAVHRARYLSEDGGALLDQPQDIWRLPTADEVVRWSMRQGRLAGGVYDSAARTARFAVAPDKETPLWDPRSKVIYWWTATEVDSARALRFAYNGHLMPVRKETRWGYLAFRAVRR
jgi:hypothetical protein